MVATPATILGAWLGVIIEDKALKKFVFVSLIFMGVYIGVRAILEFQ